MTLAERLAELRDLQAMTMKEAGIAAGFPERNAASAWWNYESGRLTNPYMSQLYRFSAALNVSVSELMQGVEAPHEK
jgi:transcriptional regulator with XRE-family HTH domain